MNEDGDMNVDMSLNVNISSLFGNTNIKML